MKSGIPERKRRWVRRGALVVGLPVVGAVVNVGVAWGCVLWGRCDQVMGANGGLGVSGWYPPDVRNEIERRGDRDVWVRKEDAVFFGYLVGEVSEGTGLRCSRITIHGTHPESTYRWQPSGRTLLVLRAGWPRRCLRAVRIEEPQGEVRELEGGVEFEAPERFRVAARPWAVGGSGASVGVLLPRRVEAAGLRGIRWCMRA